MEGKEWVGKSMDRPKCVLVFILYFSSLEDRSLFLFSFYTSLGFVVPYQTLLKILRLKNVRLSNTVIASAGAVSKYAKQAVSMSLLSSDLSR